MNQFDLDSLAAARQLSEVVLRKADFVFHDKRRMMENRYHMHNGIFARV